MTSACFLGVDVGTSGVKAILVAPTGDVLASAVTPLQLSTPRPGWAEQDPEAWWQATVAAIKTVIAARARRERRGYWYFRTDALVRISRRERQGHSPRAAVVRWADDGRVQGDHRTRRRRRSFARARVQSGARGIYASQSVVASPARAAGVRAPGNRTAGERLRALSPHRRAGQRTVGRIGDADVRHRAPPLEHGDSRRSRAAALDRSATRRFVRSSRPR